MTIDDPTLAERPFTETHDRILQALVEQVHDMSVRLTALEASVEPSTRLAPPEVPSQAAAPQRSAPSNPTAKQATAPVERKSSPSRATRPTGWQPTRR